MPVSYPLGLPTVLASKRISKIAPFSMAQPRRGTPYVQPTGTDTPTIFDVEWLLLPTDALILRNWVERDLEGGALEFTMPLRIEEGVVNVTGNFMPDGLLDRSREGTLWRYRATVVSRGVPRVAQIPEQEVTLGVAFTLNLSPLWPADTGVFRWSILSGALPAGLTLNDSTGVVSGTTTANLLVFPVTFRRENLVSGAVIDSAPVSFVVVRIVEVLATTNSGTTSAVGVAVSGLPTTQAYRISLLPLPRAAFSGWPSDSANGGLTWACILQVNTTTYVPHPGVPLFATSALAYAASANFSAVITGSSIYRFWIFDNSPGDNRGGLTVKLRPEN